MSSRETKEQLNDIFRKAADSHGPDDHRTAADRRIEAPKKEDAGKGKEPTDRTDVTENDDEFGLEEEETPPKDKDEKGEKPEGDKGEEKPAEGEPGKGKGGKTDPWKVVNHIRKQNRELLTRIAELEEAKPDADAVRAISEESKKLKDENMALRRELAARDYATDPDFIKEYEQPHRQVWDSMRNWVKSVTVTDAAGNERPATLEDIATVATAYANDKRKGLAMAGEMFGDLAQTVISKSEQIIDLEDRRAAALAKGRKDAYERQQQQLQARAQVRKENAEMFKRIDAEQVKQRDFLRPREGDTEYNERLKKADEYVKSALAAKVDDPSLPREQREEALKKLATVYNRAKGFSAVRLDNKRLRAENAKLKSTIAEMRGSEPGAGKGRKETSGIAPVDAQERMHNAFRAAADVREYRP